MTAQVEATRIDPLRLRRVMGRSEWGPPRPFGPAGWQLIHLDGDCSILVSQAPVNPPGDPDQTEWIHASMTRPGRVPDYEDLCRLHRAVWGDKGESYHVFAPASDHVNIHAYALHLWGRADGRRVLPAFGSSGSI